MKKNYLIPKAECVVVRMEWAVLVGTPQGDPNTKPEITPGGDPFAGQNPARRRVF